MADTATLERPVGPNSMTPASQPPPLIPPPPAPPQAAAPPQAPVKPEEYAGQFDADEVLEFDDGSRYSVSELHARAKEADQLRQRFETESKRPAAERVVELLRATNDPQQQAQLKKLLAQTMLAEAEEASKPKVDPASLPSDDMVRMQAMIMQQQQVLQELLPDVENKQLTRIGSSVQAEISSVADKVPFLAHAVKDAESLKAISRNLVQYNRQFQAENRRPMAPKDRAVWAMEYDAYLRTMKAPNGQAPVLQQGPNTMYTATQQMNYPQDRIPNPVYPGQVVFQGQNGMGNAAPGANQHAQNQQVPGYFNGNADFVPQQVPAAFTGPGAASAPQPAVRITNPNALRMHTQNRVQQALNDWANQPH